MMNYESSNYVGMHLFWWVIWIILIIWIFATPYYVPGQRKKNGNALDVLNRRLASGEISNDEYMQKRELMRNK